VALSPIFVKDYDQWKKVGTFWVVISMSVLWVSIVIVLTIRYMCKKSKHDKKKNKPNNSTSLYEINKKITDLKWKESNEKKNLNS
jgi:flagellar basal body-associated protein FliL